MKRHRCEKLENRDGTKLISQDVQMTNSGFKWENLAHMLKKQEKSNFSPQTLDADDDR